LSFLAKMPPAPGALRLDKRVANGLLGAFPPVDFLDTSTSILLLLIPPLVLIIVDGEDDGEDAAAAADEALVLIVVVDGEDDGEDAAAANDDKDDVDDGDDVDSELFPSRTASLNFIIRAINS
jgi:hypothetical protein